MLHLTNELLLSDLTKGLPNYPQGKVYLCMLKTAQSKEQLVNSKDRNAPIRAVEKQPITAEHHAL